MAGCVLGSLLGDKWKQTKNSRLTTSFRDSGAFERGGYHRVRLNERQSTARCGLYA